MKSQVKAWTRLTALGLLLGAWSVPSWPQQDPEEGARRLWDKRFDTARSKPKPASGKLTPTPSPTPTPKSSPAPSLKPEEGELVGVTFWRLRPVTAGDEPNKPRLLVQKDNSQLVAERVAANTEFKQNDLVRFSVELPRERDSYLYVIDRELYADGSMGTPYLIFPTQNTPEGGNVVKAGKVVYVPARADAEPYFRLELSKKTQVSELLTLVISPEPLNLQLRAPGKEAPQLAAVQVEAWENQWGGVTKQIEAKGGVGKGWTTEEKEAGEGKRQLVQGDPLPQTIYQVAVKPGGPVLITVPMRIVQ